MPSRIRTPISLPKEPNATYKYVKNVCATSGCHLRSTLLRTALGISAGATVATQPNFAKADTMASPPDTLTEPPFEIGKTATKAGKFAAILVFADIVSGIVVGKSMLGIAQDGGQEK